MKVSGQVILISGASSGIGRATAIQLGKSGNNLIITARRQEGLEEVATIVRKHGSRCLVRAGDGLDEAFCREVVRDGVMEYGRIDIALLNIGIGPPSNTLTASAATIKRCMRVNYDTFIHFYVPVMAQMKQQQTPSMICHMNSLASYFGIPMQGDYTAAKGAVRLFLETVRMELKHFHIKHIHIQTIHPGFVDTLAVRDDGIPAPGEISEEKAAEFIIKGIRKNKKENMFPMKTALGVRIARRFLPRWLVTKAVLSEVPKDY